MGKKQAKEAYHEILSAVIGILALAAVVLSGCALLFPEDISHKTSSEAAGFADGGQWVIAAQGEGEPQVCREGLSRWQARHEAKEALKEEEEVQELKGALASLGKRLYIWRAQGCLAQVGDGETSTQGLLSLAEEGEEVALVEIPAGRDAALYLAEAGGGGGANCGPLSGGCGWRRAVDEGRESFRSRACVAL